MSGEGGGGKSRAMAVMVAPPMVRLGMGEGVVQGWRCGAPDRSMTPSAVRTTPPRGGDSKDAAEQLRGGTTRPPAHRIVPQSCDA